MLNICSLLRWTSVSFRVSDSFLLQILQDVLKNYLPRKPLRQIRVTLKEMEKWTEMDNWKLLDKGQLLEYGYSTLHLNWRPGLLSVISFSINKLEFDLTRSRYESEQDRFCKLIVPGFNIVCGNSRIKGSSHLHGM